MQGASVFFFFCLLPSIRPVSKVRYCLFLLVYTRSAPLISSDITLETQEHTRTPSPVELGYRKHSGNDVTAASESQQLKV